MKEAMLSQSRVRRDGAERPPAAIASAATSQRRACTTRARACELVRATTEVALVASVSSTADQPRLLSSEAST